MMRTFKLMTVGALGAWMLMSTGCEDKVCQESLQTCKKDSTDQRKECEGNLIKIRELKTELDDARAKVDSLTKANEELMAKAAEGGKAKGKEKKGKKKRRRRR